MKIDYRVKKNKIYAKIYGLWYNLNNRCYNKSNKDYSLYGERGVAVCDKWRTFDGFLEEVDLIDGFDLEKILNGKLALDKDSKNMTNKIYCLEWCNFITKVENNKFKPNQQRIIIGICPAGEEKEFFNQSEFARENNLSQSRISECLRGKYKTHKGWKFKYKVQA